jgi:hypothetical protein
MYHIAHFAWTAADRRQSEPGHWISSVRLLSLGIDTRDWTISSIAIDTTDFATMALVDLKFRRGPVRLSRGLGI